ncbi:MAG: GTPase [Anaerolineales bacterium]|nr:GTPase [Anaerolineales bacterium]
MERTRVLIMGAAGRDFHNFNVYFRDNSQYEVIAFTATQIPDIEGRVYPPELAGDLYSEGIPIYAEDELDALIRNQNVDQVIFAYSDISHREVMHKASQVLAAGADYRLMGSQTTQITSTKPVISVCAVRTGCGKSQTTRRVADILQAMGKNVVVVRHPMPYGDLRKQIWQRFADYDDLDKHECTIEEREEYEPHIDRGVVVYAGVDYEEILKRAQEEADVVLWDGGNNDLPFYRSDLQIVVADPHRAGHEIDYHPGEVNLRMADVIVLNKVDTADMADVTTVQNNIRLLNPKATVVFAASPITVEDPTSIAGARVLVVEDGPTLTHGEMTFGAGTVAAERFGAAEIIDPRPYAVRSIQATFEKYPDIGILLPAMGYGDEQVKDLEETIANTPADLVIVGTPIDLQRVIKIKQPSQRVRYELQEIGQPTLAEILNQKFGKEG